MEQVSASAKVDFAASTIHLCIAFDSGYIVPFYALLASVFANNRGEQLAIHTIAVGVGDAERAAAQRYAAEHGQQLFFYAIDDASFDSLVTSGYFSKAVYYRLLFPMLLPADVARFIYLDTDTIVVNSLRELFAIDLAGHPVGAVADGVQGHCQPQPQLGITLPDSYFNSGVLLIDRPEWLRQQITEKTVQFIAENPKLVPFPDQDGLNAVLVGNWQKLSFRFNVVSLSVPDELRKADFTGFLSDKVIIHYTSVFKPWSIFCTNRLAYLYHRYHRLSPKQAAPAYTDAHLARKHFGPFVRTQAYTMMLNYPGLMPRKLLRFVNQLLAGKKA